MLQFLARDQTGVMEKKLRRQIADKPKPKIVLYYNSSNCDYSQAANAITASIGEFTRAAVLFFFCLGGDGWNKCNVTDARWGRYREWRRAQGDTRRLYDAPGHLFEAREGERLSKVIEFALQLGWDALVTATPGRQLLFLSHDDWIAIYRGFEWRSLSERLIALGYWHRSKHTDVKIPPW
jgi:hypothetical protein